MTIEDYNITRLCTIAKMAATLMAGDMAKGLGDHALRPADAYAEWAEELFDAVNKRTPEELKVT